MLSNTAVPIYYGEFKEKVKRGLLPVSEQIKLEMNRIDNLIDNPNVYYDDQAVEDFIAFCKEIAFANDMNLFLSDAFKLWAEQLSGWYYFADKQLYVPGENGEPGHYELIREKKRLINKQYAMMPIRLNEKVVIKSLLNYIQKD